MCVAKNRIQIHVEFNINIRYLKIRICRIRVKRFRFQASDLDLMMQNVEWLKMYRAKRPKRGNHKRDPCKYRSVAHIEMDGVDVKGKEMKKKRNVYGENGFTRLFVCIHRERAPNKVHAIRNGYFWWLIWLWMLSVCTTFQRNNRTTNKYKAES